MVIICSKYIMDVRGVKWRAYDSLLVWVPGWWHYQLLSLFDHSTPKNDIVEFDVDKSFSNHHLDLLHYTLLLSSRLLIFLLILLLNALTIVSFYNIPKFYLVNNFRYGKSDHYSTIIWTCDGLFPHDISQIFLDQACGKCILSIDAFCRLKLKNSPK